MKKKVRVYKPIQKAQEGAQVQQPQQQVNPEMLMNVAAQSLMEGVSPEDVYNGFIKQGVDAATANQIVSQTVEYINDQQSEPGIEPTNIEDSEQANQVPVDNIAEKNNVINDIIMGEEDDSYLYETNPALFEDTEEMKCGGHVSKKTYVNNAMKLAKKQMGGQENSNKVDSTDTARGDRSMIKPNFIEGLKDTAMTAALKKQAEMQYDMLMGQNEMPYGMDPMMAQRGGQQRRMNKQMDRFYRNMSNMMPSSGLQNGSGQFNILNFTGGAPNMQGMQQGMMNPHGISKIDVRRSGILGRPKEYSIDFFQNQQASTVHNGISRQLPGKETAGGTGAKTSTPQATPRKLYVDDSATSPINETGTGTGGTGTGEKPKPVVPEVEEIIEEATQNSTSFFDPEPWKEATSELFDNQHIIYQPKVNQEGQWTKDGGYSDPNKQWKKDRSGNWYRGDSKTPIKDKAAISKLNKWVKEGLLESTVKADGADYMSSSESQAAMNELMAKPQAAMADDKFIQTFAFLGARNLINPTFQFKPFVKGFIGKGNPGMGATKLPGAPGAFSRPSAWGAGPKSLPYKGYNVHYLEEGGFLPEYQTLGQVDPANLPVQILDKAGNVTGMTTQGRAETQGLKHRIVPANNNKGLKPGSFVTKEQIEAQGGTWDNWGGSNKGIQSENSIGNKLRRGEISQADYNRMLANMPSPQNAWGQNIPAMYPPLFGGRRNTRGMSLRDMIYPFNPAVQYAGSWGQQQGAPRDAQGNVYSGPMNNAQLSRINVTKSGLLGRPKRYTMDFNVPGTTGSAQGIHTNRPTMYKGSDGKMHVVGDAPQQPTNQTMTDEQYEAQFPDRGARGKIADFFYNLNKGDRSGLFDKIGAKIDPWDQQLTHDIKGAYQPPSSNNESTVLGPPNIPFPDEPINMPDAENIDMTNYNGVLPAPNMDLSQMPINMPAPEVFPNNSTNTPLSDVSSLQRKQLQNVSSGNVSRNLQPFLGVPNISGPSAMMEGVPQGFNQEDLFLPQNPIQTDPYDFSDPYTKHLYDRFQAENIDRSQSPYNWQPSFTDEDAAGVIDFNAPPKQVKAQQAAASARNTVNKTAEQVRQQAALVRMSQISNILNGSMGYVQPWLREALKDELKERQEELTYGYQPRYKWTEIKHRQIGGELTKYQSFGQVGPQCPPGFRKNANGVCEQIFTGEKQFGYKSPSSFGGAEMSNPFAMAGNTNPITGESTNALGFDASGDQYKNEGVQYDGTDASKFSVDFKNKNMYDVDFESGVNQFNMFANMGAGFLEKFDNNKNLKRLYDKTNADELYASQTGYDRGWYDPNSGLIDEMGFTGVAQSGGQMPGEETYMSEEQIRQFLADGGELEFI
jgi:hypothetical protein